MKYVDEFRDRELAQGLASAIAREADPSRHYNIMEFCGGHTHAIFCYGVQDLMPGNVSFVHGPGCPVCVLPVGRLDNALELAEEHRVILCSYGDMLRVPASKRRSLLKAKADGADVRMVYSVEDALKIARQNPERDVVFFAIGFETTTPPTQNLVADVFELRAAFEWRGLGLVPYSALRIKELYAAFDAERRYNISTKPSRDAKSCECPSILRGAKKPTDCKLFGTVCTPDNPIGSCMVSSEGACAAYWSYGRFRKEPLPAEAAA